MIDAYEIGVQLTLQDGVSAGLEVIGRELAEVDRAIAATSAGLQGLTRAAEGAVRAASAIADVRGSGPAVSSAQSEPLREITAAQPTSEPTQVFVLEPVAPVRTDPTGQGSEIARTASPGSARQPASDAPQRETVAAPLIVQRPATTAAPGGSMLSVAPREEAVVVKRTIHAQRPEMSGTVTSAVPTPMSATAPVGVAQSRRPMRASVAKAVAPQGRRDPATRSAPELRPPSFNVDGFAPQSAREPGFAEGSAAVAPRSASFAERGAAPQPKSQEQGESNIGSVMLDGRLVGYWLSEQMAREASRPPGGTSFFDPRQTPAWTPSGAV